MPRAGRVLAAALCLALARSLRNTFRAGPRLFDIGSDAVFVELQANVSHGRLWSFVTLPGVPLTVAELQAGVARLGGATCWRLGAVISDEVEVYGHTECGFAKGSTYAFRAYVETRGGGGGTAFAQEFTVPPDPWPLPYGPYCFDLDIDYFNSTVESTDSNVEDPEACQSLCQASATCLHFRYVHSAALLGHRNCSLLSWVRPVLPPMPAPGLLVGPRSCETRSVNSFRPKAIIVLPEPPAARSVPFAMRVKGVNFMPDHDRVALVPPEQPCDRLNAQGQYLVNGSRPSDLEGWARLPCNGTAELPAEFSSLLVCGRPPESVVVEVAGRVKLCLCDAGRTPYGCDHEGGNISNFFERALQPHIDIAGPYPDQLRYCAASKLCYLEDISGHKLDLGDRMMLRENCTAQGPPLVLAYTVPSLPADRPFGLRFFWEEPNTVVCPEGHRHGPCVVGRMCYCLASHGCTSDGHFGTDAGTVIFYGSPGPPGGIKVLQEDYRSFKLFWEYPEYDGGGPLRSYHLDIRTCPRGGLPDGPLANVTVLVEPGDNHHGLARNGTHQFRSISFGWYNVSVQPATRYCVRISARNDAGEGNKSQEFVWVTDVHPPTDLRYLEPPLFLVQGVPMANLTPVVTTQDCRDLESVVSSEQHVKAEDCDVQLYDVIPGLPQGLSLDPLTGTISGTPVELSPRPQVYMVTATNRGGKSSFYISLATVDPLEPGSSSVAMCLSSPGVNDAIITFQTGSSGVPWYSRCAGHPQGLRLTSLDSAAVVFSQSSGDDLGSPVPRPEAVPCGRLVLDVWSSSPDGFPPPGLCFWDSTWVEVIMQGGQAFEAGTWYQLVLKLRITPLTRVGTGLLRLQLLCSEASADEDAAASLHVGVWTPASSLPRWRAELSPIPPTPLATPVANAPWVTGRPIYLPGLANPLFGEAPSGEPLPWGFPAPGPVDCFNATSWCPTAPHQFVNSPNHTAWYTDADFPSFVVASGDVELLTPVLTAMRFNPFGLFGIEALPRPEVAVGQVRPLHVHQQEFTVDFALYPDSAGRVMLQRDLSICPSSPLQWPMLTRAPTCEISSGPVYVQCSCSSTLPASHPAARCDRVVLHASTQLDLRSQVTATLKVLSGDEPSFAGFLPIRWYGEVKSEHGGLLSFHKEESAGLLVAPDLVLQQMTPDACAEACLGLLDAAVPCRSFKFHRVDSDCYLSQHVETEFVVLKRDWPGDPYDNYEYQEQLVFSSLTWEHLSAPGVFFSELSVLAEAFLDPPPPSEPPFAVPHFFPSYTAQPHLVFALEVVAAVPIYGQDPWSSRVLFLPPSGFLLVALQAFPSSVPTPQGLGYCGAGAFCSWFLSWGQVLWPKAHYRFRLTLHNPHEVGEVGQRWIVQVHSAGFNVGGPLAQGLPLDFPHPLPIEGQLQGCSAHLTAAEETLDLFFVLPRPWDAGSTLQVLLPDTFPLPSACRVKPLTPWLSAARMACALGDGPSLLVRLDAPLRAGAAVGLQLLPLQRPSDFTSVHPGSHTWPMITDDALIPQSLNVRLQLLQPLLGGDACHPAAWSCGLDELGLGMAVRPARDTLAELLIHTEHAEPKRRRDGWVQLEFVLNSSLSFGGALDDVLLVRPPHGYALIGLHAADVVIAAGDPRSGQLNLPTFMPLAEAVRADSAKYFFAAGDSSALQVRRLHGELVAGERYRLNLSFRFPASGSEPALLHPTTAEPGNSACSHIWGLGLESGGEPLASAFVPAAPLSFLAQFEARCTTVAFGVENVLTLHFATTERGMPRGSLLMLVFSLPGHFELMEPAVASESATVDATAFGSSRPEAHGFQRLGCPNLLAHSRGRLLRVQLAECAVHFNDAQDVLELALVVDRLPAATTHQLVLRVRNPPSTTVTLAFALSAFRTAPGRTFAQLPPQHSAEALGAQLRLQQPLRTEACSPLLPAMQAAVEASLCALPGLETEVAISFIVPEVLQPPVHASVGSPPGYTIAWSCNTSSSGALALPTGKSFELLSEVSACAVSPDGRSASFTIAKTLKARSVWHVLSLRALNPLAEEAPAAALQHAWSLVVGSFAGVGLAAPPLRLISELQLRELPSELSNSSSGSLALRMRTNMAVPTGGYMVLHAPLSLQCEADAPALLLASSGACFVERDAGLLGVVLEASLPPAVHELRFTAAIGHNTLLQDPLLWRVESWGAVSGSCEGNCCSELRADFLGANVQLVLLERGVLEAFPPGAPQ